MNYQNNKRDIYIDSINSDIVDENNAVIGSVTSGTQSPILSKGIGLGYVNSKFAKTDSSIGVFIREKNCTAKIVKLPFIKS